MSLWWGVCLPDTITCYSEGTPALARVLRNPMLRIWAILLRTLRRHSTVGPRSTENSFCLECDMENRYPHWRAARTIGTMILVAGACRDYMSNSNRSSPPLLSQTPEPAKIRPEEAAFAELARRSPASAGFYLDREGQLVVVVRDEGEDLSARSAIGDMLSTGRIRDPRVNGGNIRIQRGQYTFNQLAIWRDLIFENVFGADRGITSLDLTEASNRITIGLARATASGTRAVLPSRLAALGIDSNAVVYRSFSPEDVSADSISWPADWDVLVGGINIQSAREEGGCTLGIIADSGTTRGLVTVSHCSEETWDLDSGPMYQPFIESGDRRATERNDPPGFSYLCYPFTCRHSDASFYSLDSGTSSYRGLIARTTSYATAGNGVGSRVVDSNQPHLFVEAVDDNQLYAGMYVHKIGMTTGWTQGQVTGTCVDESESYGITLCTYESDMLVDEGDSGSPVFVFPQNNSVAGSLVTLVGIVKAAHSDWQGQFVRSVFSKWSRIVTDLGALNPTREITLSTPSLSGSMIFTYPSLSWSSVSGATRYDLYRIGNGGTWSFGPQTATTRDDGASNVLEYVGGTEPGGSQVGYYVVAVSATGISARSNTVWYRAATGSFSVSISGPSVVGPNNYDCSQWVAYVTGASSPLTYAWSGHFTGSGSYVQGTIPQTGASFQLIVVDSQDRQGGAVKQVSYNANHLDYCQ